MLTKTMSEIKEDVWDFLTFEKETSVNYPFKTETEEDIINICNYLFNVYGGIYDTDDIYDVCENFIGL